ncbi:MAG: lysophospholipid acyltransferase family protein [Gemmatimonadales bacterium]
MQRPTTKSLHDSSSKQTVRKSKRAKPISGRSKVSYYLWSWFSYALTNFTVLVFWVLFRVLNRTTVIGRENVGHDRNTILLSNHQSMIDSFLVGLLVFFPKSLVRPHLIPWNPAAEENFYGHPILAWLSTHWRCIRVKEGRRDLHALHRMVELLPTGVMTLFPEGTRSRDRTVGPGKPGAGLVILGTRPKVVPVAIDGMSEVLPIGKSLPRIAKRIYVIYGPPVDYSDFLGKKRSRETAQALVDRVMEKIREQHQEIRRLREARSS